MKNTKQNKIFILAVALSLIIPIVFALQAGFLEVKTLCLNGDCRVVWPVGENLLRTYTGLVPITVNNDTNQVGLNVTPTDDWNGLFDGFEASAFLQVSDYNVNTLSPGTFGGSDGYVFPTDVNGITGNFNDINIFDITGAEASANLRVTSSGITNLETSDGRFRITHPTQSIFLLMGDGASNNANPFKFEPGDDHFQTIPGAGFGLFFFEDSADGENKELRIYGFPSGEQKNFASFRIDGATNDLNIHTEQAGSKVLIENLNVHDDLNVGRETILTDANITNDFNAMSNIRILDGNLYITEDFGICFNEACTKFMTYNGTSIVIQS